MFFRSCIALVVVIIFFSNAFAQPLKVFGTITNTQLEPLPYASIEVKEEQIGKSADAQGHYEFTLREGKYDLIITMLGYKTQVVTIVLDKKNLEQNIFLEQAEAKELRGVKIVSGKKDRGAEIIRKLIEHKDSLLYPSNNYSCELYIKAFEENQKVKDSLKIKSFFADKKTDSSVKKKDEFAGLNMAEVSLRIDFSAPEKIKQIKNGIKKYGNTTRLFYLNTTDGDFNFYKNLIYSKNLSTTPFLSPFSYSGLIAYRFRLLQSYDENGHHYYKIKITPGKLGNALMSGFVIIQDSVWAIKKIELEFPSYHLPQYDYFKIVQNFEEQQGKWLMLNQTFYYNTKTDEGKLKGSTIVSYSQYDLNKIFPKKYFGNEVGYTVDSAYTKDSSFWNRARVEPLQPNEVKFIRHSDSIYQVVHSNKYLDSIDKATNKITFGRVVWNGLTFNNHYKERTFEFNPLLTMFPSIVLIGGLRITNDMGYKKRFSNKKFVFVNFNPSYGLLNKDLKGTLSVTYMYNAFHRSFINFETGRDFELFFFNDAYLNLLKRSNFYQDYRFNTTHSTELFNGFYLINELNYSYRSDLHDYKLANTLQNFFKQDTINHTLGKDSVNKFPSYNAIYSRVEIDYTPFQKYLHEPLQKIILGSRYPTFYASWKIGIPKLFGSLEDFNYVEFGMKQHRTLGLAGIFNFNFLTGKFISSDQLQLVDYKFLRRGDPVLFSNPLRNFQALSNTFSVLDWFYELHVLHEFNGAILNKIPVMKKLQLLEVTGGGLLYVPERKLQYAEFFVGLEKIFRLGMDKYKVGFYLVGSAANDVHQPLQYKFGLEKYNILRHAW